MEKLMNKLLIALGLMCLTSCSTTQKQREESTKVLKNGIYYHEVEVALKNKVLNFRGVNKISPSDIHLIFLSSFGSTLISYHQNFSTGKNKLYYNPKQLNLEKYQIYNIIEYVLRIYEVEQNICSKLSCQELYRGMTFTYWLKNNNVTQIKITKKNMIAINIQITGFKNATEN